jgi:hypothetical protein
MNYKYLSFWYKVLFLLYFGFAFFANPTFWEFYLPIHFLLLLFFILTSDLLLNSTKEKKIKNIIIKYSPIQIIALLSLFFIGLIFLWNYSDLKSTLIINYFSWVIFLSSLIRIKIEPVSKANDY